jgi:hypothetical protein
LGAGLSLGVVSESLAEDAPHDLKDCRVEVAALVEAAGGPAKAGLQREAVYQVEFSPHNYARRCFARLLYFEAAVLVAEVLTVLRIDPSNSSNTSLTRGTLAPSVCRLPSSGCFRT